MQKIDSISMAEMIETAIIAARNVNVHLRCIHIQQDGSVKISEGETAVPEDPFAEWEAQQR